MGLLLFLVSLVDEDLIIEHFFVHFGFDLSSLALLLTLLIVFDTHEILFGVTGLLVVEEHWASLSINI